MLTRRSLGKAAVANLTEVFVTTPGGQTVSAALARPGTTPAAAVLLVHEWRGLNDQIKSVAAALADVGYLALAVDLYKGQSTNKSADARALMGQVVADEAVDTLGTWARWLKAHDLSDGKLGTVGWCFGGGWSLGASLAEPADATVVYYGRVGGPAERLVGLKGPILGHYATNDQWINKKMVSAFEVAMNKAGKAYTSHWYEANHAFGNPSIGRYDQADAQLAWRRTLDFFKANLKT